MKYTMSIYPFNQLINPHLWSLYADHWSKRFEKYQAKEKMKTPIKKLILVDVEQLKLILIQL